MFRVFHLLIINIISYLSTFIFVNQWKKTNPRSQGQLPHVARQRLVIVHRFRQSVHWEPEPRNPVAALPAKEEKRKTDLPMQLLHQDVEKAVQPQGPPVYAHGRTSVHECKVCKKRFTQFSNLHNHRGVHTVEKPHRCKICKKQFGLLRYLTAHMRTHTGERPYKCDVCAQSFGQSSTLQNHRVVHTGEKPHQCKICKKWFTRLGNLKVHLRKHTREKQHQVRNPIPSWMTDGEYLIRFIFLGRCASRSFW